MSRRDYSDGSNPALAQVQDEEDDLFEQALRRRRLASKPAPKPAPQARTATVSPWDKEYCPDCYRVADRCICGLE